MVHECFQFVRGIITVCTVVIVGLVPPSRVREGVVTDSSIELLWDPAGGRALSFEVVCLNCDRPHMVNTF